jgi:ribosomal protein S1
LDEISNSEMTTNQQWPPEVSYELSQHARDRLTERTTLTEPQLLLLLNRKAYTMVRRHKALDVSRDELKGLIKTSGKTVKELMSNGVIKTISGAYEYVIIWSCSDKIPFTLVLAADYKLRTKTVITVLFSEINSIHDWSDINTEKRILSARRKSEVVQISDHLENFHEGMMVSGTVEHISNWGAFLDINGSVGFVHNKNLSWRRRPHPSEVLVYGEEVTAKILSIDHVMHRISLGIKQLSEDPWKDASLRYPINGRLFGTVTKVVVYGVFVEVERGIEGLLHISKIGIPKTFNVGDEIEVIVLEINEGLRRISLGQPVSVSIP